MNKKNLLIISNNFPNHNNSYVADIFVKEQLKYLKNYFKNVYVVSPVAYGMQRLRKTTYNDYQYDNVKVFFPYYINIPLFYNLLKSLWISLEARAIRSTIKKKDLKFDLIHAHFTWPSGAVAVELKKLTGVPVIITEHTHQTLYNALEKGDRHYIATLKDSDAIIRVNKKDVPLICNYGVNSSKVYFIPNGYDFKKFYPIDKEIARKYLDLPTNFKIILNISRLYEEKGQKDLISAMSNILKFRDDVICFIGGTGPLKHDLEHQISVLDLQKNVKLVGFIPDEQMCLWINAADIFVLPSLGEGNPTVMFEVLGCGIPFVGTMVGGIPEVIISEKYGLLVDPANPDDLAEKILTALDREWNREEILSYAEKYTWENITKEIIGVYGNVT